jgi:hypothetical protein
MRQVEGDLVGGPIRSTALNDTIDRSFALAVPGTSKK